MKIKTAKSKVADDYFDLVRKFPLRPIRKGEYKQAIEMLKDLVSRADTPGLTVGERDYADTLTQLVGVYDDKHYPIEKSTPLEMLRFFMDQHKMNTTQLGKLLGSGRGQASLILNGKRELSKANIRVLAERFKVSAALFL